MGEYTYMYNIQKDMHQRGQQGEVPRLRDRIRIGECEMVIFHVFFQSTCKETRTFEKSKRYGLPQPVSTYQEHSDYVKAEVNV